MSVPKRRCPVCDPTPENRDAEAAEVLSKYTSPGGFA